MCGLTGYIDFRPATRQTREAIVGAMAWTLYHRGPDDGGTWVDPEAGVALGFRRLSIIDLSPLGHQPMVSASGRYVIVFNGEIYNFKELKARLAQEGVTPRGHSDTEVLLEAVALWGERPAIAACEGMFAMAIWDRQERKLTLARDRAGIKPLYWGLTPDGVFLFGSELKALRRHPAWRGEIDRDAVALFMRYGYVPAPYSIYRNVWKLETGALLTYRRGIDPKIERYWDVREIAETAHVDPVPGSDEDRVAMLEHLMMRSVKNEMVSDVPLGAFLSGGIDSSLVTALMQANSERPIKTFTIGFNAEGFNEARHAAAVAQHIGTEHTELYVSDENVREVIPNLPIWYDEPFADFVADPDLSRVAAGARACHRRAVRRWRRRDVCRLPALSLGAIAQSRHPTLAQLDAPRRRRADVGGAEQPRQRDHDLAAAERAAAASGAIAEKAGAVVRRFGERRISSRNRLDLERSGERGPGRARAAAVAHRSGAGAGVSAHGRAHDAQRYDDLPA